MGNEGNLFITGVPLLQYPLRSTMASPNENNVVNTPNDLSSAQEGQQFSFSSPTTPSNQPPVPFNPSPSLARDVPSAALSKQDIQTIALQLQNTTHWLGQLMQQRGLSTLVNALPVIEEPQTNGLQPTLNHPQTNS
ncbi:hypothetical protein MANES_S095213v8 [Manihot esculenta]|uniref:Uncharacterized protein n=1 Tax=Manihot esculenta TaxID=3983 RepID=A0ACB7FVS1_MANES|nr:hypothetical protein MANES_S095213v8 [Manihot esculenta]